MKYLSLIDQLALLVNNEKPLKLMKNPYEYDDDEIIYDIFGATITAAGKIVAFPLHYEQGCNIFSYDLRT
jgi:hypothetical protein